MNKETEPLPTAFVHSADGSAYPLTVHPTGDGFDLLLTDIARLAGAARRAGSDATRVHINYPATGPAPTPSPEPEPEYTFFGQHFIVVPRAKAVYEAGRPQRDCELTELEFQLAHCLGKVAGETVTHRGIKEAMWPDDNPTDIRNSVVTTHVCQLRHKLGMAGAEAILTVWGIGYRAVA